MRSNLTRSVIAACLVALACAPDGDRKPQLDANPAWAEPRTEELHGVRFVENSEPRALLQVSVAEAPVEGTRLLFWGDQAAARDDAGYQFAASAEDHEVLMFDADLSYLGALSPQGLDGDRLQRPLSVAAGPAARLAAFEAAGTVLLFDRWGREFRRIETPFAYAVGAWDAEARLTLARSPFSVPFVFEPEDAPLLISLDPANPEETRGLGRVRAAIQPIYIHAANAGTVAVDPDGDIYFAALGRAEVEKYSAGGERLWVSRRRVDFETPEPRLVPNPGGTPRLMLATVQKASAIGPDGLLYIRSAANAEATRDRLDVLDPANGAWLRSAELDTGTAVLVGRRGAVWELTREALLAERTRERRPLQSFALETFDGGRLSLADLNGKVALVTFWASWCTPCRDELPLLDSLNAALERPDFEVIGINEDVNEEDARQFADELGLRITLLLGRGRMRQRYHYSGLPYSVLIDRDGRIVREYYGFGGREAFDAEVVGRVLAELGSAEGEAEAPEPGAGAGVMPAMAHDHGPARDVTGGEMAALARHLPEASRLHPASAADVPDAHWEIVRDALAQVDQESAVFMEHFPGTFPLIQIMTLKSQLHVDVERLPALTDPDAFAESWDDHLSSIRYLLEAYETLQRQLADTAAA